MKIFLDDERNPPDDSWTLVRTAEEFRTVYTNHRAEITTISFDHDLGTELTGYTCLCWVEKDFRNDRNMRLPELLIHTWNPSGRRKMELTIQRLKEIDDLCG